MEPNRDDSPINKFLTSRGEGLHHIALETDSIEGEVTRMKGCGVRFLGEIRQGSRGTTVAFIHPKSLHGVSAELCSHPKYLPIKNYSLIFKVSDAISSQTI